MLIDIDDFEVRKSEQKRRYVVLRVGFSLVQKIFIDVFQYLRIRNFEVSY
jgi:hypothetical protein